MKGAWKMLPSVLPTESDHVPVLADEVVAALDPRPGEAVVDATFGAGGHASLLAKRLQGDGKLTAIDRDPTVAPYFERFRRSTGVRARLLHGEFSATLEQLAANGAQTDVILLDLGVSSMQLDRPERGFSYAVDAPLDMRMDPSASYSARELVNETDERELADIFKRFGEERYAKQIARAIVRRRKEEPFERTGELVDVIKAAIPAPGPVRRRAPGEARLPGAADRGQRRARRRRAGAAGRVADAAPRRPARRDQLPLARGPDRQAVPAPEPSTAARARRTSPSACAARNRRCARRRAARSGRPQPRSHATHAPSRRACASARRPADVASASHAHAAVAEPLARPRTRAAARGRKRRQPRARGGILWIAMSGILLAGVVFVNVAVLRLNLALDGANADRVKLRGENAALQSELSSRLRSAQIQAQASKQLGLVFQDPSEYGYVDLAK